MTNKEYIERRDKITKTVVVVDDGATMFDTIGDEKKRQIAIDQLILDVIGEDRTQQLPSTSDEDTGRFYRDGGYNFAKRTQRAIVHEEN